MIRKPTREELEERVKQPEKEPFEIEKAAAEMALFRRFTEASGQGLGMADLEGHVIYANPTLCRFMGEEKPEDPIGKDVRTYYAKEELPILENEILPAVFKEGQKTAEISLISLKGALTHTIQNVFLIRDKKGEPVYLANIITDITDRKQAEEKRKELEAQLRQAQKLESIGTLTSGVAHKFRNILASFSLFNQLVQVKYEHDPYLQEMVGKANRSVKKGTELVQELLQFSSEQSKEFETVNVAEVVRETCDLIGHSLDRKINLSVEVPDSLHIKGDHSGLSQALMNLCANARDAMPKGGKLGIEARKEGDRVLIFISDTGHGMDKKTEERCFDPFFTTKNVEDGTGLGLSTTYSIVKDHGGEIHVSSELNRGTTFKLDFPRVFSDEEPKQAGASEIMQGMAQKVLVVDDEEALLEGLEMLVESLGYRTESADNAKAAIEKYKSWQPDLVLLDRNMPEMDGITCAKRIIEYDPGARIVLVSGYEQEGPGGIDNKTKALIKGYLTKPIDMEEVSQLLSRLFANKGNDEVDLKEQLPTGKEHILFVDDEISIAKMGSQILNHFGYSVTTRTSGIEALELFQTKPNDFDLVITDMTMPNLTGDKLAVELKKIRSDIPIILCTGQGKKVSDEIAPDIGISAIAYKPVTKADLANIVRKVLDRAKSENQG